MDAPGRPPEPAFEFAPGPALQQVTMLSRDEVIPLGGWVGQSSLQKMLPVTLLTWETEGTVEVEANLYLILKMLVQAVKKVNWGQRHNRLSI